MKRDVQIPTSDGYWKKYHIDSIFDVYKREFIWDDFVAHAYWQSTYHLEMLWLLSKWHKGGNIVYKQIIDELIAETK